MTIASVHRGALARRSALALTGMCLTAVILMLGHPAPAAAYCEGTGCLPGSGYTFDKTYECGLIYERAIQECWYPGVLGEPPGERHTWGWGSADYDGSGTVPVIVLGELFFGHGNNLARACYANNCDDQNIYSLHILVGHTESGARHTIIGHAEA